MSEVRDDRPGGRPREVTELLWPGPAEGLAGLLGVPLPDLERDGLPPLWHWLHLLERPPESDLGRDGHPTRGVVPEPVAAGRRRMWAGGRVRLLRQLRVGAVATRRSSVGAIAEKRGRSGAFTVVAVDHVVTQDGRVAIEERQDIVYRDEPNRGAGTAPSPPEPATAPDRRPGDWLIDVSPTLLFRFSALTYNAHRIHYDRDYARDVEGYTGLVVHGPLQAVAMAEAARARGARQGRGQALVLDYRLEAPLIDHEGMAVRVDPPGDDAGAPSWTMSVHDLSGRRTASATLRPA